MTELSANPNGSLMVTLQSSSVLSAQVMNNSPDHFHFFGILTVSQIRLRKHKFGGTWMVLV